MRDNWFLSAHAHLIQISLSLHFYFVETERAIPEENHTWPEGWLCSSIEALLQSVHGWQCRQITVRESQREGPNQRKRLRCCQSLSHILPPLLRTFNLFKLSWLAPFSKALFVSRRSIMHLDSLWWPRCGKVIYFRSHFYSLLNQWCIIAVSSGYAYRAGLCVCVCEWHAEEARGEIGLSGSIIAAIKPCCHSGAHNQSWGGKLTAE